MSILQTFKEDVEHRLNEAYGILMHIYSEEQINKLLRIFLTTPHDVLEEKFKKEKDEITYYGVLAFLIYGSLSNKLNKISDDDYFEAESMADMALDSTNALSCLTLAGWKPSEKYANERIKQRRNQPLHRNTDTGDREVFIDAIEAYKIDRGNYPKNYQIFLRYLESNYDFEVDLGTNNGIIDHPDWKKCRRISTIQNWFREELRKLDNNKKK